MALRIFGNTHHAPSGQTEIEFFLLTVLLGVPFVWVVIRTVLALLGS